MKIQKLGAVILAGSLAATGVAVTTLPVVSAAEAEDNKAEIDKVFTFRKNDDETLTAVYKSDSGVTDVEVPAEYNGIKVTAIDGFLQTDVVNVKLPESITSIADFQFRWCDYLKSVNIPDGVSYIGTSAFEECASLEKISVPDGVKSIENNTFTKCSALTEVKLGKGIEKIGDAAFQDCSALAKVNIPDGVTSIGIYAFQNCSSIESLTLPETLTSIGGGIWFGSQGSFANCSAL